MVCFTPPPISGDIIVLVEVMRVNKVEQYQIVTHIPIAYPLQPPTYRYVCMYVIYMCIYFLTASLFL